MQKLALKVFLHQKYNEQNTGIHGAYSVLWSPNIVDMVHIPTSMEVISLFSHYRFKLSGFFLLIIAFGYLAAFCDL